MSLLIDPDPQLRFASETLSSPPGGDEDYPEETSFESEYPEGFLDYLESDSPPGIDEPSLFSPLDDVLVSAGEPGTQGEDEEIDGPVLVPDA